MADDYRITGSTKLIGLIGGSAVRHSSSPVIHNAVFEKMGYDYAYVPFEVTEENLEAAVRGMEAMGFLGYNVAAPLKKIIAPYLYEISEVAEIMGAVNTVVVQGGRSYGDNTDGAAFMRNLVFNGVNVHDKKMTVLGAGGAGSAIIVQAALDGVAEIDVFNLKDMFFDGALELIERLQNHSNCKVSLYDHEDEAQLNKSIAESEVVVNATRIGSTQRPGCILNASQLHPGLTVVDVVYTPAETELVKMARENGNRVIDGVGAFVQQAAIGERLWIGRQMPIDFVTEKFFGKVAPQFDLTGILQ